MQKGFSLVELMVGVAVMAIFVSIGVPAFSKWMHNSQIRTATESIQAGLQLARAEAVRRNMPVRFQLVSNVQNGCALALNSLSWVISLDNASGSCGERIVNDGFSIADTTNNPPPRILQKYSAKELNPNIQVVAGQSTISFNGLGRQVSVNVSGGVTTPNPPTAIVIEISNPNGGNCAADTGNKNDLHCLRISISPGGNINMSDPAL